MLNISGRTYDNMTSDNRGITEIKGKAILDSNQQKQNSVQTN